MSFVSYPYLIVLISSQTFEVTIALNFCLRSKHSLKLVSGGFFSHRAPPFLGGRSSSLSKPIAKHSS